MTLISSNGSCFANLPEDLLSRIFLLLPVACLLRVKWVCKSWLSILESSSFVDQHLNRSNSEDNHENKLIVFNLNDVSSSGKFISVMDFQSSNNVDFKLNIEKRVSDVHLIGSFNGIVCLMHNLCVNLTNQVGCVRNAEGDPFSIDWITVVSLWNPATKHVKILPPPLVADSSISKGREYLVDYGFGFDARTNDYRVVRLSVGGIIDATNPLKSHVQVYSLSTDSWHVIDAVVPLKIRIESNPKRPFMNGICCWYGWDYLLDGPAILTFDFNNEVFGTLPMFEEYRGNNILTFLGEKLTCINWAPGPSKEHSSDSENDIVNVNGNGNVNYRCKVWVLEKCGVKESWIKLYSFMILPRVCPIGFMANGKVVLKMNKRIGEAKFFLLDPASQVFNNIPLEGTVSEVAIYKESLVSIEGANGETYRVDSKWQPTSKWELAVSQWIMGSCDRFAGILYEDAGGLVVFNEPEIVPRLPAQTILPTRWSPPLAGTIKLNTAAIMDSSSRLGAFGFVARNAAGIAVKAVCSNPLPMTCISTAKAEAIRNALFAALHAGWDSIVIESHCERVVDTIKGSIIKGSSDRTCSFFSVVTDINILSTNFGSISFCFVPKDLNTAARTLASHGYGCNVPSTWDDINAMPDWLKEVLAKDLVR